MGVKCTEALTAGIAENFRGGMVVASVATLIARVIGIINTDKVNIILIIEIAVKMGHLSIYIYLCISILDMVLHATDFFIASYQKLNF